MVGSSLQMNGEDSEMTYEEEGEEGGEILIREKAAPVRGRDRHLGSGSEVEAQSFMGVADRQVGGEADHTQLHGHDHRSAKPHREGLTTEEVCIEGPQIEGHRHDGPQIGEARL